MTALGAGQFTFEVVERAGRGTPQPRVPELAHVGKVQPLEHDRDSGDGQFSFHIRRTTRESAPNPHFAHVHPPPHHEDLLSVSASARALTGRHPAASRGRTDRNEWQGAIRAYGFQSRSMLALMSGQGPVRMGSCEGPGESSEARGPVHEGTVRLRGPASCPRGGSLAQLQREAVLLFRLGRGRRVDGSVYVSRRCHPNLWGGVLAKGQGNL